jgi:hypothetical protein
MKASVGISNIEFVFLLRFKKFFERLFEIDKNLWFAYISTHNPSIRKREYFKRLFDGKITIYKRKLAANDAAEIRINNVVLAEIFHCLIDKSLKIILSRKDLSLEFLKGYEVGDGSIITRKVAYMM